MIVSQKADDRHINSQKALFIRFRKSPDCDYRDRFNSTIIRIIYTHNIASDVSAIFFANKFIYIYI